MHTPTPWAALSMNNAVDCWPVITSEDRTDFIAELQINKKDREANAAFIVKAVNCHEELVNALESILKRFEKQIARDAESKAVKNALSILIKVKG